MAAPFEGAPVPAALAGGVSPGFRIITADERLAERHGIKMVIFGKSGIGKTSLLWTVDPEATLFFDMEAGDLAIEGWPGASIRPWTWIECRDFAMFIGGPNPAVAGEGHYGQQHYDAVRERYGDPAVLDRFEIVFVNSITVASRLCFAWAQTQPEAFSEKIDAKTGRPKPDLRGAGSERRTARAGSTWSRNPTSAGSSKRSSSPCGDRQERGSSLAARPRPLPIPHPRTPATEPEEPEQCPTTRPWTSTAPSRRARC